MERTQRHTNQVLEAFVFMHKFSRFVDCSADFGALSFSGILRMHHPSTRVNNFFCNKRAQAITPPRRIDILSVLRLSHHMSFRCCCCHWSLSVVLGVSPNFTYSWSLMGLCFHRRRNKTKTAHDGELFRAEKKINSLVSHGSSRAVFFRSRGVVFRGAYGRSIAEIKCSSP